MRRLSAGEVEHMAAHLAQLGQAGLPLPQGLQAAAEEAPSKKLADALRAIAASLQQGKPLNEALAEQRNRIPPYLSGYVAAASKSGDFGGVLSQLLEDRRNRRELHRSVWSAIAYPLLLLGIAFLVCFITAVFVVPGHRRTLTEFDLDLPLVTVWLFWICEVGIWWLLAILVLAAVFTMVGPALLGKAAWHRWKASVPVFGRLSRWSGVAELSRLLAVLLDHRVRLPEALATAADGSSNADMADACRQLAADAQHGRSLAESLQARHRLPASVTPFVIWGEQSSCLPDAFRTVAEMFDERVRLRSLMLRSVLPPFFFLFVAAFGWFVISGLFLPLVELISALSGGG